MTATAEDRIDHLDALLGQFVVSVNTMVIHLDRAQKESKQEMKDFKDEMKDFKDEMKDFKDEMKDFKDEMKDFKHDTEADRRRMNKQWGELANKMGTIVEDIVVPNIPRVAEEYFHVNTLDFFAVRTRKRKVTDNSVLREFDIIAVSDKYFIVNETKSTPKIDYIDKFIEVLPQLAEFFPEYKEKTLIPIFSSLYIPENIISYLSKHNIYALGMRDETMDVLNFEQCTLSEVGA